MEYKKTANTMTVDDFRNRLFISVKMVEEILSLYRKGKVDGHEPRIQMIGENLYQLGGEESLKTAKNKILLELGNEVLLNIEYLWRDVTKKRRDPLAIHDIILIETSGYMTTNLFKQEKL